MLWVIIKFYAFSPCWDNKFSFSEFHRIQGGKNQNVGGTIIIKWQFIKIFVNCCTRNGRLSALTPDRQPARQGISPPPHNFTLCCLAYDKVLAGTMFNVFGMTRKVSFSSELGTLTSPISTAPSYFYLDGHPSKFKTWPKLLNLRDRRKCVFHLSQSR